MYIIPVGGKSVVAGVFQVLVDSVDDLGDVLVFGIGLGVKYACRSSLCHGPTRKEMADVDYGSSVGYVEQDNRRHGGEAEKSDSHGGHVGQMLVEGGTGTGTKDTDRSVPDAIMTNMR